MIYQALFQKVDPRLRESTQAKLAARSSILDLVRNDANYLKRKVGKGDQRKLDRYFDSVREVEKKIMRI